MEQEVPPLELRDTHHRDICTARDTLKRAGLINDAHTVETMLDRVSECHRLGLTQEAIEVVSGVKKYATMVLERETTTTT